MKNAAMKSSMSKRSIPALVAVGSSLAALPAAALELGELTVQSRLGQPLRASIAFALAPNEQISDYCVALRPGASLSGLPGFGPATISISNGVIMVAGQTPVREPMVSAHVVINCPYSANLSREYMLLIDPMIEAYEQPVVTQQAAADTSPVEVVAESIARPQTTVRTAPVVKDLGTSTRYQVKPGDDLGSIAQRIENRPIGLWPAANAIFEANPDAFLNNDPNQLKSGSWLTIPSFDGSAARVATADVTIAEPVAETPVAESTPLAESAAYEAAFESSETDTATSATVSVPVESPADVVLDDLADTGVTTADLQPGDIVLDTELQQPAGASSSPNVPTAIIRTPAADTNATSSSRMYWFAGGGLALIFGLLMFGRRLRGGTDTAPTDFVADQPNRRFSDAETANTDSVEALGVDFDLSDDSPTQENLALDADLAVGTGLAHNAESGVSEDFGFAAATELDVELPFEPVASISDTTDMLLSVGTDEVSILDSEILPESDDDYDMSVIIDATKMPQPEDVTERDLRAVEVTPDDETEIAQHYTINKEVDYQVLEQDYEDEMTATQALNQEIAKAAHEIAERMESTDDDATAALPLASVTELDVTAQMPAQNDEISDLDDTGINEAITVNTAADDETAEMPIKNGKAS